VEPLNVFSEDDSPDLVQAAETSTDFWDNPWDDEDWNQACENCHIQ